MLPQQRTVGRKPSQDALGALDVDIAGLRVDRRTGGGVTGVDIVAEKIAEQMVPEFFPGLRVETGNPLLQAGAFAEIPHHVQFGVGDHGGGRPREIDGEQVIRPVEFDFVRQTPFGRTPVLFGTTPVEPTMDGGLGLQTSGGSGEPADCNYGQDGKFS